MVGVSRQPQDMRPGSGPGRTGPGTPSGSEQVWRWAIAGIAVVLIVLFIGSGMFNRSSAKAINFSALQQDITSGLVQTANFNNTPVPSPERSPTARATRRQVLYSSPIRSTPP